MFSIFRKAFNLPEFLERMKKNVPFIILFCLLLPVVLSLLSYRVTLLVYPLTEQQQNVIEFLHEDHELQGAFTAAEISHLEDVRLVLIAADGLLFFSFLALLILLTHCRREKELLNDLLKYGGICTVALSGIVFFCALFTFNQTFVLFHQLFFPQGNWQFPADSLLLTTFPEHFFNTVSLLIFLSVVVIGSLLIALSVIIERKRRKKK